VEEKSTLAATISAVCGQISGGAAAPARQHFAQLSQAFAVEPCGE